MHNYTYSTLIQGGMIYALRLDPLNVDVQMFQNKLLTFLLLCAVNWFDGKFCSAPLLQSMYILQNVYSQDETVRKPLSQIYSRRKAETTKI